MELSTEPSVSALHIFLAEDDELDEQIPSSVLPAPPIGDLTEISEGYLHGWLSILGRQFHVQLFRLEEGEHLEFACSNPEINDLAWDFLLASHRPGGPLAVEVPGYEGRYYLVISPPHELQRPESDELSPDPE